MMTLGWHGDDSGMDIIGHAWRVYLWPNRRQTHGVQLVQWKHSGLVGRVLRDGMIEDHHQVLVRPSSYLDTDIKGTAAKGNNLRRKMSMHGSDLHGKLLIDELLRAFNDRTSKGPDDIHVTWNLMGIGWKWAVYIEVMNGLATSGLIKRSMSTLDISHEMMTEHSSCCTTGLCYGDHETAQGSPWG